MALALTLIAVSGCAKPVQRFVPIGQGMTLDTKTGLDCLSFPKEDVPTEYERGHYPMCVDLYHQSN